MNNVLALAQLSFLPQIDNYIRATRQQEVEERGYTWPPQINRGREVIWARNPIGHWYHHSRKAGSRGPFVNPHTYGGPHPKWPNGFVTIPSEVRPATHTVHSRNSTVKETR